jgi:oligopeptide/dipeptide ABC transporter ATP-binding protein
MKFENNKHLLEVNNLKTFFYTDDGIVKAVDGVDFYVKKGEILGLVGESGCGKSVTSLSIMNLIEAPGHIESGEIFFEGQNILNLSEKQLTQIRGNHLSMIFQQPLTSLDPVFSIGEQIKEVFDIHKKLPKDDIHKKTIDMLKIVGIPDPDSKVNAYPHQMSGGQAQRVMIAMALALEPKLLIADEPTTALDVTIQSQILDILRGLQKKLKTSIILITHDLGVIAEMADRVAVMYAGKIVEQTEVHKIFNSPLHPYTQGLLASVPILNQMKDELETIPGNVPNLIDLPPGCRFASRCKKREEYQLDICNQIEPDLFTNHENSRAVRCWLYQDFEGHKAPMKEILK